MQSQNKFELAHRTALYRIQNFYQIAINETTINSQANLIKYIRNNGKLFVNSDYDNVTATVQAALQLVASN
jgi:hypothetical protein